MGLDLLLVGVGAAILIGGGELLVRGAAALARTLGVSAMIVGLTVVAMGTSAPELVVSGLAAYRNNPGICVGNVVGSNILNVLLVLGVTAVIYPLQARADFVRREVPFMVCVTALFLVLASFDVMPHEWASGMGFRITRAEAVLLCVLLISYLLWTIRIARRESAQIKKEFKDEQAPWMLRSILLDGVLIILGLALLGGGSELFLRGAIGIAKGFGVSDALIGLTLVALGTSFPELAACIIAAYRKHPDICLGNLIGSSIFNILAIAGISGLIRPLPVEKQMAHIHVPVMVGAALLVWGMVASGSRINRREGVILLFCYAAYMGWTLYQQMG